MLSGFWQKFVKTIFVFAVFTTVFSFCGHNELRADVPGWGSNNGQAPVSGQVSSSSVPCCRHSTEQVQGFQQNFKRQEELVGKERENVSGFELAYLPRLKPLTRWAFVGLSPPQNTRLSILQTFRS
jgi:hypothetical protein